jgi:hypothetical protein
MEYRILSADATTFLGADFARAVENLSAQVNLAIRGGWAPLGGVTVGYANKGRSPFLFQTMVKGSSNAA